MFMFIDGRPVVLSFALVEGLYYKAFTEEFPDAQVSLTQWRGSYEYQAVYADIQMIVETGVITRDAMAYIGQSIVQANEAINRPACLYSRVPERFKELGYEATIRVATEATKGIVAICVDAPHTKPPYFRDITLEDDGFSYAFGPTTGSISDAEYQGVNITQVFSVHDGSNLITMSFDGAVTPNNGTQLAMNFSFGADLFSCLMAPHATEANVWTATDSNVAPLFAAAFAAGQPLGMAFWGDNRPVLDNPDDLETIGNTIRQEMLPGGQWMEGDVVYKTALSNGQPIDIKWTVPSDVPTGFRTTITRKRGSPYPQDTVDEIIEKFLSNYDEAMGIGSDITPQVYLTVRDVPWASSVLVEWFDGTNWWKTDYTADYNVRYVGELLPANVVIQ